MLHPSALARDLRFALRRLRAQPVFSGAMILLLALTIGANTAIFTVVEAVLLRQLPFAAPDRLVVVHAREAASDSQPFSIPDFLDLRAESKSLERLAGFSSWSANLTGIEQPVRLSAQWATAGFFELLGVRAAVGRTPLPEEERPGGTRVVLLGDALWRTQFGGDPSVVGQTLTLNGEPFVVLGVLPPEFVFFAAGAQLVAPLVVENDNRREKRGAGFLRLLGRLSPGADASAATRELDTIVGRLRAAHPGANAGRLGVRVEPLAERIVGGYKRILLVLWGAVALVLLVACTNLANLLLSRLFSRKSELALRAALGARPWDLVRQLLGEAVVLSLIGGALGALLAWLGVATLPAFAPEKLPRVAEIRIRGSVLAFNLGLSLAAGLLVGLLPALLGSRASLVDELRTGGRGRKGGPGALVGPSLVAIEVGLALVLLVGGGLLLRSLHRLQDTDPGYRPDNLLSVQLSLPKKRYANPEAIDRYRESLTARIATLPGVKSVAAASLNPLTAWRATISYTIEGRDEPARDRPLSANYRAAGPGYFETLGIPLLRGRDVSHRDRADTTAVAVISASLERRHFAKGGALGSRLVIDDTEAWRTVTVVGVVGDVKHTGLDAEGTADVYVPYAQTTQQVAVWLANIFCVAVRTEGDPHLLVPAVRREITALDPEVAASAVRSMDEAIAASLADRRFNTTLLQLFGAVALALAVAGVYAMTAIGVASRRHEIGVRVSVGASRGDILALVVKGALTPVGIGVLAGIAAALASSRLLRGLLFGVPAHDAAILTTAALSLCVAALAACLGPAMRATRIDPAKVLRAE
ncbi:MAG: ABC transporter permease [Acidobacteria bacterium]|nr:ABC transporter permease [Acidobacteriota bacterium]